MKIKSHVMVLGTACLFFISGIGIADQSQPSDSTDNSSLPEVSEYSQHIAVVNTDLDNMEEQSAQGGQNLSNSNSPVQPAVSAPSTQTTPSPSSPPPPWWKQINVHGDLETLVARHLENPDRFSELNNQLSMDATGAINDSLHYRISGRVYYDSVYDLGYYPKDVVEDQKTLAELRDTYLDYSLGQWDIRVGKQQIVWGESAGVFVADIVNAEDLRQFLLPDFDMIRIPEWGTDLEYAQNDFHSEFVFIPVPAFNKLGLPGSEFPYPIPVPEGTAYTMAYDKKPDAGFENAKYGARFSYLLDELDLGAFYLHSWDENPVFYRTIDGSTGSFNFNPQYKRLDTLGGTFSDTLADSVVRGEMVYNFKNYFSDADPQSDGVTRSNSMEYALGADHTFFEKNIVGVQFIQNVVFDYNSNYINQREFSNYASISWQRDFFNQKLTTEFFAIAGLDSPDYMYRPDVKFNITSNWQIKVGLDIFEGHPNGLFSEFTSKSRYYIESDLKF